MLNLKFFQRSVDFKPPWKPISALNLATETIVPLSDQSQPLQYVTAAKLQYRELDSRPRHRVARERRVQAATPFARQCLLRPGYGRRDHRHQPSPVGQTGNLEDCDTLEKVSQER
jgi:hypothetical protein